MKTKLLTRAETRRGAARLSASRRAAPRKAPPRRTAPLFAALGDETRLRLMGRLSSGGPASIAALTSGVDMTRQAVTKHLNVLAAVGLVRGLRRGRERLWAFEPDRLDEVRHYLEAISQQWDHALGRLRAHVESRAQVEDEK